MLTQVSLTLKERLSNVCLWGVQGPQSLLSGMAFSGFASKMSPESNVLKVWSPACELLDSGTLRRRGLGEEVRSLGLCP
jgi:hypothetical protein